jgi:hypothetical protein
MATPQAILIQVKNAAELARSQGAVASLAQSIAPETIEAKVYSAMAEKLADSLKKEHVDATITIVNPVGYESAGGIHWLDVGLGAAIVGSLALILRFTGRRKK